MRIGGLASGMDIDELVGKMMAAEKIPLDKMQQKKTTLNWKTEAFRGINTKLLDLDKMMTKMKLSTTYQSKSAASSQDGAVTATAKSGASNGSYSIEVTKLASGEMQVGSTGITDGFEITEDKTYTFTTYNEDGTAKEHKVDVKKDDTLKDVLKEINTKGEGRVRASYDASSDRVILETIRTGKYNINNEGNGNEITFGTENKLFTDLGLELNPTNNNDKVRIIEAQDATFKYNGLEMNSKDNNYTINDVTFQFNNVTEGNAQITISNNVDDAFDNIIEFVDKYNEVIDEMNQSQSEKVYRDFPPLTKEQEEEMSEREIEQWEEKAKSGLLRGEASIRGGMTDLRQSMQGVVDTGGEYTMLSQIGIATTKNYMDGGKLEIDEGKLKEALQNNSDDVYKLFSSNTEGSERGLINRFDDALDRTRGQIEQKAGKSSHTLDNYSIGRQMKQLDSRIESFEKRLEKVENRYWGQFTAMEKAISDMNQQADYLFSQFGGGQM